MSGPRHYSLFGLLIRSDIELPELIAGDPAATPDAVITIASVPPPAGTDRGPLVVDGAAVLVIEGVARYAVRDGRDLRVEPAPGADERDIRLYLLGSAMGLLLHQRGLLPLHANAIELHGGAVLFAGASGGGKSTLASWFHDRGVAVIADDVCVVHFDAAGAPVVSPGVQRLRLWRDALEEAGRDPGAYPLSFGAPGSREKFDVPLAQGARGDTVLGIRGIYILERGDRLTIEPLTGVAAAEALFAHTYRGRFLEATGSHVSHWQACVAVATRVAIYRAERRWGFDAFDAQNQALLDHVGEAQSRLAP